MLRTELQLIAVDTIGGELLKVAKQQNIANSILPLNGRETNICLYERLLLKWKILGVHPDSSSCSTEDAVVPIVGHSSSVSHGEDWQCSFGG